MGWLLLESRPSNFHLGQQGQLGQHEFPWPRAAAAARGATAEDSERTRRDHGGELTTFLKPALGSAGMLPTDLEALNCGHSMDESESGGGGAVHPASTPATGAAALRWRKGRFSQSVKVLSDGSSNETLSTSGGRRSRSASPLARARGNVRPKREAPFVPTVFAKEFSDVAGLYSESRSGTRSQRGLSSREGSISEKQRGSSDSASTSEEQGLNLRFREDWEPELRLACSSLSALRVWTFNLALLVSLIIAARFHGLLEIFGPTTTLLLLASEILHVAANVAVHVGCCLERTKAWTERNIQLLVTVLFLFPILGSNLEFYTDERMRSFSAYGKEPHIYLNFTRDNYRVRRVCVDHDPIKSYDHWHSASSGPGCEAVVCNPVVAAATASVPFLSAHVLVLPHVPAFLGLANLLITATFFYLLGAPGACLVVMSAVHIVSGWVGMRLCAMGRAISEEHIVLKKILEPILAINEKYLYTLIPANVFAQYQIALTQEPEPELGHVEQDAIEVGHTSQRRVPCACVHVWSVRACVRAGGRACVRAGGRACVPEVAPDAALRASPSSLRR